MISFKFLKSSLIYTVSGALPLATGFLLLGVYTKYLEKDVYGMFSMFMSFTLLMQIFINLGIDASFQFFYYDLKNQKDKLNKYLSTVFLAIIIIGTSLLLLFLAIGPWFLKTFFELDFFPFGLIALGTAIFNSLLKAYSNFLIQKQQPNRYFVLNVVVFLVIVVFTTCFLYYIPNALIGPLGSRFLAGSIVFLTILFFIKKEIGFFFSSKILKKVFSYSLPIFLMLVLSWIQSNVDRLIIIKNFEFDEVGIYDFAFKCVAPLDFLLLGLWNTIAPKIYSYWSEKKINYSTPEINRYWNAITSLIIIFIAVIMTSIPWLLGFLDTADKFKESKTLIPLLSLTFIFRGLYMMFMAPLLYFKSTKSLPKVYFIVAVSQILLSYMLIKGFGLFGAVAAIFLVKIVEMTLLYIESRKVFKFKFNVIKIIFLPFAFFVTVVLINALMVKEHLGFANLVITLLSFISIILIYRNELKQTLNSWKFNLNKKVKGF